MQISRIIVKILALMGLALALTVGTLATASTVGAQEEPGYTGCGYDGYEACEEPDPDDDNDETATPELGNTGGALPETGGVQLLAVAGAVAAIGLTIRRLSASS